MNKKTPHKHFLSINFNNFHVMSSTQMFPHECYITWFICLPCACRMQDINTELITGYPAKITTRIKFGSNPELPRPSFSTCSYLNTVYTKMITMKRRSRKYKRSKKIRNPRYLGICKFGNNTNIYIYIYIYRYIDIGKSMLK